MVGVSAENRAAAGKGHVARALIGAGASEVSEVVLARVLARAE